MEGFTWIRLGSIAALFLGSVYVLMPTALQGDLEAKRAKAAQNVDIDTDADHDIVYESSDVAGVLPVLEARLDAAGVKIDNIKEKNGDIVVVPGAGVTPEDIEELAANPGKARLFDPLVLAPVPDELPAVPESPNAPDALWTALQTADGARLGWWSSQLNGWYGAPIPAGTADLGLDVKGLDASTLDVTGTLPESVPFGVVAVDDVAVGLVFPGDGALRFEPLSRVVLDSTGRSWTTNATEIGLLKSGPMPAPITRKVAEQSAANGPEIEVEQTVPDWLLNLMPDTVLSLGLDLQGGLDITLQVELDDALQAQVGREAIQLRQEAETNKLGLTSVIHDKYEPVIWVEAPADKRDAVMSFISERRTFSYFGDEDGKLGFRMKEDQQETVKNEAVEQVLETLRKRVDATGVKEPSIVKKPGGRINIQLPGAVDLDSAIDAIGTTAMLEFRMVDSKMDWRILNDLVKAAEKELTPKQFADDEYVNNWLVETKRIAADRAVLWNYEEDEKTGEAVRQTYTVEGSQRIIEGPMLVDAEVPLTGNDVNDANVSYDQQNQAYVALNFKPRGTRIFCDLTTRFVKQRFAIILDGQIRSAPTIKDRICGGRASIEMGSSMNALKDAQNLSLVLRTGSLDAPVSVGEVRQVGAQLGADSIRSGSIASVAGGVVVLFFMALWYRRAGLIANVALALNVLMVIAALALFGATLTLPGIAGIALTVGMAVDANIIIFERIREELELGVHPRKAVDVGFDKGLVAVLDANITTAIAGIVLYSYGTGPIKGFAVTLLIGIVTTLITALFVTRTFMELVTRSSTARITI